MQNYTVKLKTNWTKHVTELLRKVELNYLLECVLVMKKRIVIFWRTFQCQGERHVTII